MTQGLSERVRRVFRMDAEVYGEAAADPALTGQALAVVLGAAFAEGLGRWLAGDLAAGLTGVIDGGLRWMVWLVAIHAAARALGSESDLAALSRGLGFASAPFALGLFEQMPGLGGLFWLAKWALGFALKFVLEPISHTLL